MTALQKAQLNGFAQERTQKQNHSFQNLPKLCRFRAPLVLLAVVFILILVVYTLTGSLNDAPPVDLLEGPAQPVREWTDSQPVMTEQQGIHYYNVNPDGEDNQSSVDNSEGHEEVDSGSDDKVHYRHTKRQFPQCIVIGVRKAGTRALLAYLNLHPQVQTASKEMHFFDNDENYQRGMEWYRKRMPHSFNGQVTIEKTPAYFVSRVAPERIYRMNSSIKLLLIVREPVDRAVSDYLQIRLKQIDKGLESPSFEQLAMKSDGQEVNENFPPLLRSVYYLHMRQWLTVFPLSQIHIVDGDALVKDPLPQLVAVEDFLGLEHRITNDNFYFNQSRGFFCLRNETMDKCLNKSKGRTHPHIDPDVVRRLHDYYRYKNKRFFHMIGREFPWP